MIKNEIKYICEKCSYIEFLDTINDAPEKCPACSGNKVYTSKSKEKLTSVRLVRAENLSEEIRKKNNLPDKGMVIQEVWAKEKKGDEDK